MGKQSLFEIVAENHQLMSDIMANGGEVTEEIEKKFEDLGTALVGKVDNYVELMSRLDSEIEHFKKKEAEMKSAKVSIQNLQKRLKNSVLMAMDSLEKEEVQGDTFRIKISKTAGKTEFVEKEIPAQYFNEVVEKKLNKKMIEEELKMGLDVPGVYHQPGRSIRKYTKKVAK